MPEQLALFLGAGASRFINMPTTNELMKEIKEWVRGREGEPYRDQNVQNLVVSIVEDETYTDIEKLYDAIEDVIRLTEHPNCKPIVDKIVLPAGGGISLENSVPELKEMLAHIRDIVLEKFVINSREYDEKIKQMFDKLQHILVESGMKDFKIFTTNYDMVIDEYRDIYDFELVDGFKEDGRHRSVWTGSWEPQSTKTLLYLTKLHGSVNWYRDSTNRIIQFGGKAEADKSILIAPTEGRKDYTVDPFSTLLKHFEEELENVKTLVVIGFSFRDDDINEIIRRRVIQGMQLIVLSPSATDDIKNEVSKVKVTDQPIKPHTKQGVPSEVLYTAGKNVILCKCEFSLDDDKWEAALGEALHL